MYISGLPNNVLNSERLEKLQDELAKAGIGAVITHNGDLLIDADDSSQTFTIAEIAQSTNPLHQNLLAILKEALN